jgi:hypothetical protein
MAEQNRKEWNREKRRTWTAHIEAWKNSDLSQVEYCREKNLSRHQFTYWNCKLRKKDAVTFVRISGTPLRSQDPRHNHAPIKLIVDSRYQIEIGDGFSPATLSMLIRTLDGL